MSRLTLITQEIATAEQQALLGAVVRQQGFVPNLLRLLANSPSALRAFLGLNSLSSEGSLDPKTRERIALALAQRNGCSYCLSAHTALGSQQGLNGAEMEANRAGDSHDAKAAIAVRFACLLIEQRGEISADALNSMRLAGFSDAEIIEVIAHSGLNFLSNLLGKASQLEIDFPPVSLN